MQRQRQLKGPAAIALAGWPEENVSDNQAASPNPVICCSALAQCHQEAIYDFAG